MRTKHTLMVVLMLVTVDQLARLLAQAVFPAGDGISDNLGGVCCLEHWIVPGLVTLAWLALAVVMLLCAVELDGWHRWWFAVAGLDILCAGLASNMLEILVRGFVTDYLLVFDAPGDWIAFNLADVWILAGFAMGLLSALTLVAHRMRAGRVTIPRLWRMDRVSGSRPHRVPSPDLAPHA